MAYSPDTSINTNVLRVANAQGFWGDDNDAPARLVSQAEVDVLTLDYLAEVSMSILAKQKQKDPNLGYARDFLEVLKSLVPFLRGGGKIVTNAGGLNPRACARAAAKVLIDQGISGIPIAAVTGDDVLPQLQRCDGSSVSAAFPHFDTGAPIEPVRQRLVTANAYVGAEKIVEALNAGARIVIGGRVADPSLVVAPAAAHFGWRVDDYDRLAGATIAGHLIECGTQSTGGISTDWLAIDNARIGFPIVEISQDGTCTVTKPAGTGGEVSRQTVTEQLLYEMGDPGNFLTPDCAVSILSATVHQSGDDRVTISGVTGRAPTDYYKVSATYRAGFRATSMLTIVGRNAVAKARRCGEIVRQKLRDRGLDPQRFNVECIGAGDAALGALGRRDDLCEVVLRVSCADERREVVEYCARQLVPLVTAGPQGTTGYFDARGDVREYFAYWPTLIVRAAVPLTMETISPSEAAPVG